MLGLTDYITEFAWTDIFTVWYVHIDDAYQELLREKQRLRQRGPAPTFSDSEVITVTVILETLFHGHEELGLTFLRQYHLDLFPKLIEYSRFNRRRRDLAGVIEAIRRRLSRPLIDPTERVRVLDSAPLPVCTYARGGQCETVTGPEYASIMASRKAKLFGLRLHMTITLDQVIDQWMLAPAAYKDGKVTPAFFDEAQDLWVLADNAYHDPVNQDWLDNQRQITLVTSQRKDSRSQWPAETRRLLNRMRRRVETAFSVLCSVFNLERLGSRSVTGLLTRIATRLLAYNLSFLTYIELRALEN